MRTVKVGYNLQNITQTPSAHLSDLFILLYTIFLIEEAGGVASKIALNKIFPFVFDHLEKIGKIEEIKIFNLPFYKMQYGHYNKSLVEKYLKELERADLVKSRDKRTNYYELTTRTESFLKKYRSTVRSKATDKIFFEDLVTAFTLGYLKNASSIKVFETLKKLSHTMLVKDNGQIKSVGQLPTDDNKAVSYNNKNFRKGEPSNIVPHPYLTLLANELQQAHESEIEEKDLAQVKSLLPQPASS